MFLDLLCERFFCYYPRQNFFFLLSSSISWEIEPPYAVHLVTHVPPATHKNLWFLTTEVSCTIGSSCSWVTSTDSFGKPDWMLSSIGVLASQERQQMLLESNSSCEDGEGRQSCSSPRMDACFCPSLAAAGVSRLRPQAQVTESSTMCWLWCRAPKGTASAQEPAKTNVIHLCCLGCAWMHPLNSWPPFKEYIENIRIFNLPTLG